MRIIYYDRYFLGSDALPMLKHGVFDRLPNSLKSQVVLLQTAHAWANAGVLLGARMHRERVAFETIKVSGCS